ncbi:MAG: CHAP domain-containing protein [Verrucomicrobiales bacterium]
MKKRLFLLGVLPLLALLFLTVRSHRPLRPMTSPVGTILASHRGVPAYQNGLIIATSHGKHYAPKGYYYGQKWQCVEFVKRYYYDALQHEMPNVWGHARDFFDPEIPHGQRNPARDLLQFHNGHDEAPAPDDLLVFRDGNFGHVAIITEVGTEHIEVIQQNIPGHPTQTHPYQLRAGRHEIGTPRHRPTGWLRLAKPLKVRQE